MDRDSLLLKLTQLDFARFDLRLYLNTHPADAEAIADYNCLTTEADSLRASLAQMGIPLSHAEMSDADCFYWIDNPWPWDRDFFAKGVQ